MTREEAIEILQGAIKKPNTKDGYLGQAIDMAIKALEQEPTTKENLAVDLIDRAELLKAMDTWDKFGNDPNKGLIPLRTPALQDRYVPYVKYDDMVNCVKGMPSVTPQEPKTGYWIFCEGIKGKDNVEKCSCCQSHWKEAVIYRKDTQEYLRTRLLYCPNCGAKMVEPQESEDKE